MNCYRNKFILLFFITISHISDINAQDIVSILNAYAKNFQPEKIYIHYDKPAYSPGETIWFKAYLIQSIFPSDAGKNFYIDWSDNEGNVLFHTVAPIENGSAFGQITIPSNFPDVSIHARAYTTWMLNFDSDFLYNKNIRIIQDKPLQTTILNIIPSIHFFPEGGDAIDSIKIKIAYKANDQFGRPVNVSGVVLDKKRNVLDSFKAMHDGMGFFYLRFNANESCRVRWIDEQKIIHEDSLPAPKLSGAILQITKTDSSREFFIGRSYDENRRLRKLHLLATFNRQVVYLADIDLSKKRFGAGSIPISFLPSGILQITLLDSGWKPLAERITFINNRRSFLSPDIKFDTLGLARHQKNVLSINVPDSIQSNLSISITDEAIVADTSENIITHFLLTGNLPGSVYNPSYYFSNNVNAERNLDLIMLTHGWRRFNWDTIVAGKFPQIKYAEENENYLGLSGKVYYADSNQLHDSTSMYTIIEDKDSVLGTIMFPIDEKGNFQNPNVTFFDSLKIYYSFPFSKNKISSVDFYKDLLDAPKQIFFKTDPEQNVSWLDTSGTYRNNFLAKEHQRFKFLEEGTTLAPVTVKTKKSKMQLLDEKYTTAIFRGTTNSYSYDISDDSMFLRYNSVFDYIKAKISALYFSVNAFNRVLMTWHNYTYSPKIFLNEMLVPPAQIMAISMKDVGYLKVFPPHVAGINKTETEGYIAIYLKRNSSQEEANIIKKNMPYKTILGYSSVKEFYSPNYTADSLKNETGDARSTLYWNPMILTDTTHHIIKLEFYNNDVTHSFRIVLEGMSKDGKLAHVEKVIE